MMRMRISLLLMLTSAIGRIYQLATMMEKKLREVAPRSTSSPLPQASLQEEERLFERCEKLLSESGGARR